MARRALFHGAFHVHGGTALLRHGFFQRLQFRLFSVQGPRGGAQMPLQLRREVLQSGQVQFHALKHAVALQRRVVPGGFGELRGDGFLFARR